MNKITLIALLVIIAAGAIYFLTPHPEEPQNVANAPAIENEENNNENMEKVSEPEEFDTKYTLNSEESSMKWHSERIVGNSHDGMITVSSGSLFEKDGEYIDGNFTIDMNSVTEEKNSERFLAHIKSADFFDVENHPTSTLKITSIVKDQSSESYTVTGDLTILGKTHEISFPATIEKTDDKLVASATFDINRTMWGITYDSGTIFQKLGDKAIRDEIKYELELVFNS